MFISPYKELKGRICRLFFIIFDVGLGWVLDNQAKIRFSGRNIDKGVGFVRIFYFLFFDKTFQAQI
jgi:hypothetical protein